jgi:hypothetical protein
MLLPSVLLLAACATVSGPGARLDLAGSDDQAAAAALVGLLGGRGVPAESGSDGASLLVYRRGMATRLEPVMQRDGLDRIISTRRYAPAPGKSESELAGLAGGLNDTLNVGAFSVEGGALVFQSQLTFLDRVGAPELLAFLDWLDTAELAIVRVDRESRVLLLSGG